MALNSEDDARLLGFVKYWLGDKNTQETRLTQILSNVTDAYKETLYDLAYDQQEAVILAAQSRDQSSLDQLRGIKRTGRS